MESGGVVGARRREGKKYAVEDEALDKIAKEAEARLAQRRAARAEARELRLKELEKHQQQNPEDDASDMSDERNKHENGQTRITAMMSDLRCGSNSVAAVTDTGSGANIDVTNSVVAVAADDTKIVSNIDSSYETTFAGSNGASRCVAVAADNNGNTSQICSRSYDITSARNNATSTEASFSIDNGNVSNLITGISSRMRGFGDNNYKTTTNTVTSRYNVCLPSIVTGANSFISSLASNGSNISSEGGVSSTTTSTSAPVVFQHHLMLGSSSPVLPCAKLPVVAETVAQINTVVDDWSRTSLPISIYNSPQIPTLLGGAGLDLNIHTSGTVASDQDVNRNTGGNVVAAFDLLNDPSSNMEALISSGALPKRKLKRKSDINRSSLGSREVVQISSSANADTEMIASQPSETLRSPNPSSPARNIDSFEECCDDDVVNKDTGVDDASVSSCDGTLQLKMSLDETETVFADDNFPGRRRTSWTPETSALTSDGGGQWTTRRWSMAAYRSRRDGGGGGSRITAAAAGSGDVAPPAPPPPLYNRRSSQDSGTEDSASKDIREVEEKFRGAMISNAQLDNEKSQLTYQVEILKDVRTDITEQLTQLKKEHKKKCSEHEQLRKIYAKLEAENKMVRGVLEERDQLIQEYGLLVVGRNDEDDEDQEEEEEDDGADSLAAREETDDGLVLPRRIPMKRVLLSQEASKILEKGAARGSLEWRLRRVVEHKRELEDELRRVNLELEDQVNNQRQNNCIDSNIQKEANKTVNEYKFKVQKAEAEVASLQANVNRLDALVARYRVQSEELEKSEEELKLEKRKLQRELREAQSRLEEIETTNSHLLRRFDKLKNARSNLLKDLSQDPV